MSEYTPTTCEVRNFYTESRRSTCQVPERQSSGEFYGWLDAHDKDIRDSVKPPAMTAHEHLEALWEAACPVPEGRDVPTGVTIIERWEDGQIWVHAMGVSARTDHRVEVRTLEPLPPMITDDCMAVWASVAYSKARMLWVRDIGSTGSGNWSNGDDVVIGEALINPVPVPGEES